MEIAILGAGRMGAALARLCAQSGHRVAIGSRRDASAISSMIATLGPGVNATSSVEAIGRGEAVLLTLPWRARGEVVRNAAWFSRKIVLDVMNPYDPYPLVVDLAGAGSTEIVAAELAGARVVKGLNTMQVYDLARYAQPRGTPGRIALPVCGNDEAAKTVITQLMDDIGFDAVDVGPLRNGRLFEPGRPLFGRHWSAARLLSEFRRCSAGVQAVKPFVAASA